MACALCTSNAPRPVAFPLRLTGSCPLNRTPSARLTSFFVTTVLEPLSRSHGSKAKTVRLGRSYSLLTLETSTWPIISTAVGVLSSVAVIS